MKVYVLSFIGEVVDTVEGVFVSYSAMVTWLRKKYNYVSHHREPTPTSGSFIKPLTDEHKRHWFVVFEVHEVIGEHSHKTNTIQFN
ncbi:MAG: hypothetical protein RR959_09130 [Erysipelotrichaceae bacterium]